MGNTQEKQEAPMVSKSVLSVFVCGSFIFETNLDGSFIYVPYKMILISYSGRFLMAFTISKM